MKATPRFPGILRAKAYHDSEGNPKLEIEFEEMERLELLLKKNLGRAPNIEELFEYVKGAQLQ